jgi:hypothetical protein
VQHSGKIVFPECPIFGTQGSTWHSGNIASPVVRELVNAHPESLSANFEPLNVGLHYIGMAVAMASKLGPKVPAAGEPTWPDRVPARAVFARLHSQLPVQQPLEVEEAPTVLEVEQALDDMVLRSGARVANTTPAEAEGDRSLGAAATRRLWPRRRMACC